MNSNSTALYDYRARTVPLLGNLSPNDFDLFLDRILRMHNDRGHRSITVYLGGSGGSVAQFLLLFDVLRMLEAPLRTIGLGSIQGITSLLLACGTKNERILMPHALVSTTGILEMPDCFPKTPIGLAPSRLTVRDRGQQLLLRHLEEVMTTDLELSEAVVKNVFEGGTIYSADEAVASRFVDTILSPHQNVHQQEATHKLCRAKNPIVIM